jgi:hypothetical protein
MKMSVFLYLITRIVVADTCRQKGVLLDSSVIFKNGIDFD